jgi:lysophospholipase L1-like esterase
VIGEGGAAGSQGVGEAPNTSSTAGASGATGGAGNPTASCAAEAPELHGNVITFTPRVAKHLREVAARSPRNDKVFMKIGDSITAGGGPYGSFGCFSRLEQETGYARVDLAGREALRATIAHFDEVTLAAPSAKPQVSTAWDRPSTAARVGAASDWPLLANVETKTVPLFTEADATNARFAVVMLGTNDVGGSPLEYGLGPRGLREYAHNMWRIVDELESRGVVPLLTYIPPVNSATEPYRKWFSAAYVAVLRAVASARQVPSVDFYSDMAALGAKAYLPGDALHPNQYPESACIFSAEALNYGHNIRNLRSLEALDKARRSVISQENVDAPAATLCGAGSATQPFVVPNVPFAVGVTFDTGQNVLNDYARCGGQSGARGKERIYRLDVTEALGIRAIVVPSSGACDASTGKFTNCDASRDVSISIFKGDLDTAHCVRSHSTLVEQYLEPGTWYVVVDTYTDSAPAALLSVHACHPDDPACQKTQER